MNYIDVKNFRKYEQLFGDNGPAKIGHVNAVIKSLNEAIANIPPPTPGLGGTNYIFVTADGTDVENAAELQAAYVTAQGMSPSSTNRITIVAAPGYYNFDSSAFTMSTQHIDLVSLDGNRSVLFNSANTAGTINVTANDVFVKGVDVGNKNFTIATNLTLLKVENCIGGDGSFGNSVITSGTFINCEGGNDSFGYNATASGIFINCIGGDNSFGFAGEASGIFIDCNGGFGSFALVGDASGVFTNCTAGDNSFGTIASGTFTDCISGDNSFGYNGTANGTFVNCVGDLSCFGYFGNASGIFNNCESKFGQSFGFAGIAVGTFTNCKGASFSFGYAGTASGTFTNCIGGTYCFGAYSGGALSGVAQYCVGDNYSFGNGPGGSQGTLDGYLYFCRLINGTFRAVSGAGKTRYCIDGNNATNNQG